MAFAGSHCGGSSVVACASGVPSGLPPLPALAKLAGIATVATGVGSHCGGERRCLPTESRANCRRWGWPQRSVNPLAAPAAAPLPALAEPVCSASQKLLVSSEKHRGPRKEAVFILARI